MDLAVGISIIELNALFCLLLASKLLTVLST